MRKPIDGFLRGAGGYAEMVRLEYRFAGRVGWFVRSFFA